MTAPSATRDAVRDVRDLCGADLACDDLERLRGGVLVVLADVAELAAAGFPERVATRRLAAHADALAADAARLTRTA